MVDFREIEKYIERHYQLEKISLEDYISLTKSLSERKKYQMILDENKKYERFSALIRKRINPQNVSVEKFEEIINQLCEASSDDEIHKLMSNFNIC
jgi:hypothetical protein